MYIFKKEYIWHYIPLTQFDIVRNKKYLFTLSKCISMQKFSVPYENIFYIRSFFTMDSNFGYRQSVSIDVAQI